MNIQLDNLTDDEKRIIELFLDSRIEAESDHCRFDHDGDCQEHSDFDHNGLIGRCGVMAALEIIKKYRAF